ncbi:MAG: tyrosine--tRNA ligase [Candidatus Yanofskybacteria bacterium]|nr:tyrosine--tRNA ligase [Candidatus Yanofskybacteria bacterium]
MDAHERIDFAKKLLSRRSEARYPSDDIVLERIAGEKKLTIYFGIDPTGADIHLGHTVALLLLKGLAELGHDIVLLVGDFTARIGDPTGKDAARVALSGEQIDENMKTYQEQVAKVLPAQRFRIAYNGEWLSALTMEQVLKLTSMVTVQQMMQRDMFQRRQAEGRPIHVSEFLYPLMQGYDSVALQTDGEVGGNDQTFNMLVGRELEREIIGKDKIVITTPLLVDATTGKKMSKSEGTLIALSDSPQEIRRKVLDVDDKMIRTLFELCTERDQAWIDERCPEGRAPNDPRGMKEDLAAELVRMYHGEEAVVDAGKAAEVAIKEGSMPIAMFLKEYGFARSMSEAKTLVSEGAVRVNDEIQKGWEYEVKKGDTIKIGKGRFARLV